MLKIERYDFNLENLLTLPGIAVNPREEDMEGFDIREYDSLRWIRSPDGTIQSVMLLQEPAYPVFSYIQALLCSLLFKPQPRTLLNLGLGSGSIERFVLSQLSTIRVVSVEIESGIIEIAKKYFHVPSSHTVIQLSAHNFLKNNQDHFDILISDVVTGKGVASSQLSPGFILHAARALNQDGVFVTNLIPRSESEVVEVLILIRKVFPWVLIYDVPDADNIILFCTVSPSPSAASLAARAIQLYQSTGLDLSAICGELITLPIKQLKASG
jgi:precorrin-6B methylase 2